MPRLALTADGALWLDTPQSVLPALAGWLPRGTRPSPTGRRTGARIVVQLDSAPLRARAPRANPTICFDQVRGWIAGDARRALLIARGALRGTIRLPQHSARIMLPRHLPVAALHDLPALLHVATALLLSRLGRALVHAGAVVAPQGGAWLLVGDARSGKSTTTATLIAHGWNYVSDDQVVLKRGTAGLIAEGWLRDFHLDTGWATGTSHGRRTVVDPQTLGPGCHQRQAPLAGALFLTLRPETPTTLEPLSPAEAFSLLLRQSPWLMADAAAAQIVVRLLEDASRLPAHRLALGRDALRNGRLLARLIPRAVR